ncbi:MAG: hypothetical protein U0736_27760 [Gemmataceae bacterium]
MPEGLWAALTPPQQRDLVRFLMELGHRDGLADLAAPHELAKVEFSRLPLRPDDWPNRTSHVNRDRVYDFYPREAMHFAAVRPLPHLLPAYPGLDGGRFGHWGNQTEATWADDRWNRTDVGTLLGGVFRGCGVTVPRGVCVRLGAKGELAACFNPETLTYDAVWRGGFVRFSSVRHGFMNGLIPDGTPLPRPAGIRPTAPFTYHGYYRHGNRVIFAYRIGDVEYLDSPGENGAFVRIVAPADKHPLATLTRGGAARGVGTSSSGASGSGRPYAVDTIPLPVKNPWNAPLFVGGHDFLPDGSAVVCTMQGDVWQVSGLDDGLRAVRLAADRRGAAHHPLGLVWPTGRSTSSAATRSPDWSTATATARSTSTSASRAFETSPAGHDFICGLERDRQGCFYTASGNQGLIRISADGKTAEVLAGGFRNPDGARRDARRRRHRPLFRGRMDAGVDGVRGAAAIARHSAAALRLSRTPGRQTAGAAAGLPAARAGQLQRRTGADPTRRSVGTARRAGRPPVLRRLHPLPAAARPRRRPGAGGGGAARRRLPAPAFTAAASARTTATIRQRDDRLGAPTRSTTAASSGCAHRRPGAACR